jgi:hypothetical protein
MESGGHSDANECFPQEGRVVNIGEGPNRRSGGTAADGLGRRENCDATEWKKWSASPERRDRSGYDTIREATRAARCSIVTEHSVTVWRHCARHSPSLSCRVVVSWGFD